MSDKKVISFEDAKSSHVFKRKEDKLAEVKKAFVAARAEGESSKITALKNKKKKKKKRNKKK